MAKPGTTHVIEIESGIGEPAFIPLTVGQELQPISVGKKGMWRIESARVLDVHAFVYFDGTSLFLQSADESQAASVDGYRVGKAWTELHAPCKIEVGAARLRFRSLLDNVESAPASVPAPPPPRSHPAPQSTGGNTRVGPADDMGGGGGERSGRATGMVHHSSGAPVQAIPQSQRPMNMMQPVVTGTHPMQQTLPPPNMNQGMPHQGMPMMAPMPMPAMIPSGSFVGTVQPMQSGGYGALGMASNSTMQLGGGNRGAATVATGQSDGLVAKYKELNPQKRLLVLMAPFCLLASGYLLLFDEEDAPQEAPNMAMDAGAPATSAQPVVVLPTAATVRCPAGYVPWNREVNGQIPCVPAGTPPAPGLAVPPGGPTVAPPPTGPTVAPPPTTPPGPPERPTNASAKTLERQAVDAVAVNDYNRAAAIYDALFAQSNPKNPVYSEAARILRQKADAGIP